MIFIDQMQEQSFKIEAIKPWEVERLEKVLVWGLGDHQWPLKDLFQAFGRERSCILGHMGNVTVEACNWLRGNIQRVTIWAGAGGSGRRRQWHPTPVLLPGKSHGRRSLVGYSPWGREESDMAERLHFHFSLPCIGEGNGNPLQCSCLENPRDGGAWWAAVYGVAQSRTRLTWLSSSSSSSRRKW